MWCASCEEERSQFSTVIVEEHYFCRKLGLRTEVEMCCFLQVGGKLTTKVEKSSYMATSTTISRGAIRSHYLLETVNQNDHLVLAEVFDKLPQLLDQIQLIKPIQEWELELTITVSA